MNVQVLSGALAALVLGLGGTAIAAEYFDSVGSLGEPEYFVTGDCSAGYQDAYVYLRDPADPQNSVTLQAPDDRAALDWPSIVAACAANQSVNVAFRFTFDEGNSEFTYTRNAVPGQSPSSMADAAQLFMEARNRIDTITGPMNAASINSLGAVSLKRADETYSTMVFTSDMPLRQQIDFYATCYEVCTEATFRLKPLDKPRFDLITHAAEWLKDGPPPAPVAENPAKVGRSPVVDVGAAAAAEQPAKTGW